MTKRSIVSVILLSIVTCGIYSIYWFYVVANELNAKEAENPLNNYIVAILLGIVTCGIYTIYWEYKFFKKADSVLGTDSMLINFILSLVGLGIVSMAIMQNDINNKN